MIAMHRQIISSQISLQELHELLKQEAYKLKGGNGRRADNISGNSAELCGESKNKESTRCVGTQDTFYIGWLRGVGRLYQQTFICLESGKIFVKLYDQKNGLIAADFLNSTVIPWYVSQDLCLSEVITDRGAEYCGSRRRHPYQLYLLSRGIKHSTLEENLPQENKICVAFHRLIFRQLFSEIFRIKKYLDLADIQQDVDIWLSGKISANCK
jgi:hypothetical protein